MGELRWYGPAEIVVLTIVSLLLIGPSPALGDDVVLARSNGHFSSIDNTPRSTEIIQLWVLPTLERWVAALGRLKAEHADDMQRIRDRLKNVGNWMAHPDGTDVWLLERAELGSASVDVCVERVAEGTYRLKSIRSFDAATYHVESYDFNEVGVTFSWFDPKLGTSKAAGTTIIPMP